MLRTRRSRPATHARPLGARTGLTCLALLTLLPACRTTLPNGAATQAALPTGSNAELMVYLSEQPYVTAEPAYRAVYILHSGQPSESGFRELTASLESEGLVAGWWDHTPDTLVDRGTVGYMIARACKIDTGLNWWLTGLGRYAWRELIFRGIAHPSGELSYISGGEFLGVLARAEEHMRDRRKLEGAPELGPAPGQ